MALPTGWPPRVASGFRSIRVYIAGTTTALFSDHAYLFSQIPNANTFTPLPVVPPGGERVNVVVPLNPWGSGTSATSSDPILNGAAATPNTPMIWSHTITIYNTGSADIELSFDGTNVHGYVVAGTFQTYSDRMESGIAVRGAGGTGTFKIEAW